MLHGELKVAQSSNSFTARLLRKFESFGYTGLCRRIPRLTAVIIMYLTALKIITAREGTRVSKRR